MIMPRLCIYLGYLIFRQIYIILEKLKFRHLILIVCLFHSSDHQETSSAAEKRKKRNQEPVEYNYDDKGSARKSRKQKNRLTRKIN